MGRKRCEIPKYSDLIWIDTQFPYDNISRKNFYIKHNISLKETVRFGRIFDANGELIARPMRDNIQKIEGMYYVKEDKFLTKEEFIARLCNEKKKQHEQEYC